MKFWIKTITVAIALIALTYSCTKDKDFWDSFIPETDEEPTVAGIKGYVFRPAIVSANEQTMSQLKLPPGFKVNMFASKVGKPRMLTVSSDGNVYMSDRDAGTVTMLGDANADGVADSKQVVANIDQAHGLSIHNGKMYIVAIREVYIAGINADGTLGVPVLLIKNLPDAGQHPNRTIDFGPDGKMYITIGSTCNSCPEPNALNATIVQANFDGTGMKIYAKGLRNTIGFGWHPQTGEMWGMDHGIDWLGDNDQKEELNLIKQNANYGWPYIFGEGKYNPGNRPPGDTTYKQYLDMTTLPTLTYQAHASPLQLAFYTGTQFPVAYKNDVFLALHGSWNRSTPVGYKVVRIHFENGKPTSFEDFLTGFLINKNTAISGRPTGIAVHSDGSLLISDDTNGVIYRVSH